MMIIQCDIHVQLTNSRLALISAGRMDISKMTHKSSELNLTDRFWFVIRGYQ